MSSSDGQRNDKSPDAEDLALEGQQAVGTDPAQEPDVIGHMVKGVPSGVSGDLGTSEEEEEGEGFI